MDKRAIYVILDEALDFEKGTIKGNEKMEELEWESLSIVSFIALVDERFEIVLSAEKVVECPNVECLVKLVEESIV